MAEPDDAALTPEQTEELRRQREALKQVPGIGGGSSWEDDLVKRQLAKNAARKVVQAAPPKTKQGVGVIKAKLPPEVEEALAKSVESLAKETARIQAAASLGKGATFTWNAAPPAPYVAVPSPPPIMPSNELALIEKMVATLLKLLPNGYRVERVANGVSDKDVCVIVRADIAAVEKPSFDKRLPFTVDPRDQLIADLIKAGNKALSSTIHQPEWKKAIEAAAWSLFDGVVPGDEP